MAYFDKGLWLLQVGTTLKLFLKLLHPTLASFVLYGLFWWLWPNTSWGNFVEALNSPSVIYDSFWGLRLIQVGVPVVHLKLLHFIVYVALFVLNDLFFNKPPLSLLGYAPAFKK